jgi:hypothetical protein
MHRMTRRTQRRIARQSLALSLATPQVVAHRLGRMAAAGSQPSARDRREFALMGAEKVAAFWESWAAMGWAAMQAQQQAWASMWGSMLRASPLRLPTPAAATGQMLRVVAQGLEPVQRRAVSNAKRLARVGSGKRR